MEPYRFLLLPKFLISEEGPPMINSNAMLRGTVLFNVRDRDLGGTVKEAQKKELDKMFQRLSGV